MQGVRGFRKGINAREAPGDPRAQEDAHWDFRLLAPRIRKTVSQLVKQTALDRIYQEEVWDLFRGHIYRANFALP